MRARTMTGIAVAVVVLLAGLVAAQLAVALPRPQPTPSRTVDWSEVPAGADASWPSCTPPHGTKRVLPLAARPAFVVVGVNDGLPGTTSACIARELAWADTTTGGSSAPRLDYYAMAADPWTKPELRWVPHPDWPTSQLVDGRAVRVPAAFGAACTGSHASAACAYVYGWITARTDAAIPGVRSPAAHRFWIDVEAVRTWSDDQRFNQAVVEGMVAAFRAPRSAGGVGARVGLYSTYGEWARIVGRLRAGSPLDGLDEWLAAGRVEHAEAVRVLRTGWPLTPGGRIVMVQHLDGALDRDVAAPAR